MVSPIPTDTPGVTAAPTGTHDGCNVKTTPDDAPSMTTTKPPRQSPSRTAGTDWYFDFISPFAYFGFLRLRELGATEITYHPILFAELLKRHGHKGPAEIPSKRTWTYRSCVWWAEQHGVPFRFPAAHPFNPLPYLRMAIAANNTPQAIGRIFEALWTTGADPADPGVIASLASELGVDPARLADDEVKAALRQETEHAAEHGVFGVPTHIIDGELFWGAEATDFVKAYLADPSVLASAEMQRVSTLPVGMTRK